MYNEELKKEYINFTLSETSKGDLDSRRDYLTGIFRRLSKVEKSFDVDISNADYETVLYMLTLFLTGSKVYQDTTLATLRQYVDWTLLNGKTSKTFNILRNIKTEDIDISLVYKDIMIKDFDSLINYLNIVYENPLGYNEDKIDIIYRAYCMLLFSGFNTEECIKIKETDVDLNNLIIRFNNKEIKMNSIMSQEIKILMDKEEFIQNISKGQKKVQRTNDGFLLRANWSKRKNASLYLRQAISEFNKILKTEMQRQFKISSDNIYISGMFNRIHKKELNSGVVDISEYEDILSQKHREKNKMNQKRKDFLIQYNAWKKAFYEN